MAIVSADAFALHGGAGLAPALPSRTGSDASSLRGVAPTEVRATAPQSGLGTFALSSCVAAACGAVTLGRKHRRKIAVARRFFGSVAAPKAPSSYRDFEDPWLSFADAGFDPLNASIQAGVFDQSKKAQPETAYYNYRESEVKHGRFAMVAFLAIFAEAADRSALFHQLGAVSAQDTLDGTLGLDEVQLPVLLVGLGYQALAEYNLQRQEDDGTFLAVEYKKDRCPGDLGFDPLGLGRGPGANVVLLHNTEVWSGRLAMVGITSFLFKEFVAKDPEIARAIL